MTGRRWSMARAVAVGTIGAVLLAGAAATAAETAGNTQESADEYAQVMADADSLERYNAEREQLLQSQLTEIASLEAQIEGLAAAGLAMPALLQRMFDALAEFVAGDLPFLAEERRERIDRLAELMASDGAIAEKFRRLMEAYRIELEYGRVMTAYRGTLGDGRPAQFIHLGRVTLLYRTVDGSETGYWDAAAGRWVADASYSRAVSDALAMANEEVAPDVLTVPIPAATETRS